MNAALALWLLAAFPAPCAEHPAWTLRLEQAVPPAAAADRARLTEILSRPEFAHRRDDSEALLRFVRLAWEWLQSLLESGGMRGFASGTRVAVLAAAVVAFVAAAVRWLLVRRRRRAPQPARALGGDTRLRLDMPATHLDRARALLAGAPREAIREGLLAMLSSLERVRFAQPDRVKTNRELADELPRRGAPPEISDRARRLFEWYDGAFYSLDPVPAPEAHRFLDDVTGLDRSLEGAR